MKIINVWLILLCAGSIAYAQSAVKISPVQAVSQSKNKPFEMTDNFSAMAKAHQHFPIFSIHERGSNTDAFMITGRITNRVFCAAGTTNAFRPVIKATETISTTNVNLKAAYTRVAAKSDSLLMTNQVEEFRNFQIGSK